MEQQTLTNETDTIFYAIVVNGTIVSRKFTTRDMAEVEKQQLPSDTQVIAEIVTVTADGKQLLLG